MFSKYDIKNLKTEVADYVSYIADEGENIETIGVNITAIVDFIKYLEENKEEKD